MSQSISHAEENFDVSLSDLPEAPTSDLRGLLGEGGAATDGWLTAFAAHVADAHQDAEQLATLLPVLRTADRRAAIADDPGSRRAFAACAQILGALIERSRMDRPSFDETTEVGRMLVAIAGAEGPTNEEIARASGLSTSQVSRTGARLTREGLASSVRHGRLNAWSLTPNGSRAVEAMGRRKSTGDASKRAGTAKPAKKAAAQPRKQYDKERFSSHARDKFGSDPRRKMIVIVRVRDGWVVQRSGVIQGGPYATKEEAREAARRLRTHRPAGMGNTATAAAGKAFKKS